MLPNLTLIYHQRGGVMRVCGLFPQKKSEKVRNINLTSTGWGALCVADSIPSG